MPITAIEEKKFHTKEELEDYLSSCFINSVKDICNPHPQGENFIYAIQKYIYDDPNEDVLDKTKELFRMIETGKEIKKDIPKKEEWLDILMKIQNSYFISLPGAIAQKWSKDIKDFLNNIRDYQYDYFKN